MKFLIAFPLIGLLTGCAATSSVMPSGEGTYIITAQAAAVRGGTTGAHTLAYEKASEYCQRKGKTAVVLTTDERDIYLSTGMAYGSRDGREGGTLYQRGASGSGTAASGAVSLVFTCEGD